MPSVARARPSPTFHKRISGTIDAESYAKLNGTFARYGLEISEAIRIALKFFAAALPVLARGGKVAFQEPDGTERAYRFIPGRLARPTHGNADKPVGEGA